MHLKDIMSHPAITCPVVGTLDGPARLMWEFDCGAVLLTGLDGRLEGIITDRDICIAALMQGKPLHEVPTETAMASRPVMCHVDDAVETAEELMRMQQVRRIPVVDGEGRPVGVVSMNDLARLAARVRRSASDREVLQTLAAICQPRTPARADATPAPISVG